MKKQWLGAAVAAVLLVWPALGQRQHDPLDPTEIDQLRDTAPEPDKRLPLLVDFCRLRITAVQQTRSDPKVKDKGATIHDRLQDFLDVYDELNDNIDTYSGRKEDFRKALSKIIEADNEFEASLQALKDAAGVSPAERDKYQFVLANALDTVGSSIADHRDLLAAQEQAAKDKKKKKK